MHKSIQQILSPYGINCKEPYYISSGIPLKGFLQQPFRTDFYTFFVCTQGNITITIEHKRHTIRINDFVILAPSTILQLGKQSDDFSMKLLFFEKNFILKNISNPFIIEKFNLFHNDYYSLIHSDLSTAERLLKIITLLEDKSKKEGLFVKESIRTIIFYLLLEVAEVVNQKTYGITKIKKDKSNLYFKFKKLVQDTILVNKSVHFYADKLNISNEYLIQVVRKSSGKSPHEIINEILLKEAYVLLGDTQLTVAEIAYKLHFNSTSSFGRFFKKHVTISPSEYRKRENLIN